MRLAMRRMICRWGFIMLCVVPTLVTGGAALFVHSPLFWSLCKASWESHLSVQLGIGATIDHVVRARDGRLVLHGLRLSDPERARDVAVIRSVEITFTNHQWNVELNQCQLSDGSLTWLTRRLHDHVMTTAKLAATVRIHAPNLVLTGAGPPVCLAEFDCRIRDDAGGREALIAFQMPGQDTSEPIHFRLVRNRQLDPPATGWELHTGATPLPCLAAARWLPALARLGEPSSFTGSVWAELTASGWNAEVRGTFQELDLDQLVTGSFPHKLSGMATVQIDRCMLKSGRISEIAGQIEATHGVISASLLNAASAALQLQQREGDDLTMLTPYDKLALSFALDADGLTVQGLADSHGAVLLDSGGTLVLSRNVTPLPPLALVRLLVPDSRLNVPATKETALLVRMLPLPQIIPTDTNNARIPYATLRLRRQ